VSRFRGLFALENVGKEKARLLSLKIRGEDGQRLNTDKRAGIKEREDGDSQFAVS